MTGQDRPPRDGFELTLKQDAVPMLLGPQPGVARYPRGWECVCALPAEATPFHGGVGWHSRASSSVDTQEVSGSLLL